MSNYYSLTQRFIFKLMLIFSKKLIQLKSLNKYSDQMLKRLNFINKLFIDLIFFVILLCFSLHFLSLDQF